MTKKPTYDEVCAAYDSLVSEKERYRTALEQIHYVEGINPVADKIALAALKVPSVMTATQMQHHEFMGGDATCEDDAA